MDRPAIGWSSGWLGVPELSERYDDLYTRKETIPEFEITNPVRQI
jgi:hypothetical protein